MGAEVETQQKRGLSYMFSDEFDWDAGECPEIYINLLSASWLRA